MNAERIRRVIADSNPSHLDRSLEQFRFAGLGPKRLAAYREFGITSVRDLLLHLPVRHRERLAPQPVAACFAQATTSGVPAALLVKVVRFRSGRRRGSPSRLLVEDASGRIEALSFTLRRVPRAMGHGAIVYLLGRLRQTESGPAFFFDHHEEGEAAQSSGSHLAQYSLPRAIPPRVHRSLLAAVLQEGAALALAAQQVDPPGLQPLSSALEQYHFPTHAVALEAARRRLAYEELRTRFRARAAARGFAEAVRDPISIGQEDRERLLTALPFTPTQEQIRSLSEICHDLARREPMHRLLHGEVGSGKSVVALLAARAVVENGRQAALLAPTALLAQQLAHAAGSVFPDPGRSVALFTHATPPPERRRIAQRLRAGESLLVIGTLRTAPALAVAPRLSLVIIDEQHRFGVSQRARLRTRAEVDLLVMTATPIPRSLALTLYGDLELSVLRERPPGRASVATRLLRPAESLGGGRAASEDDFIRPAIEAVVEDCAQGGRVFVLCPRIDSTGSATDAAGDGSSHAITTWSVTKVATRLRRAGLRVAVAHGKNPPAANDAAVQRLRSGEIDVLVATTVIEVGIDVEQATTIVVLGAERFGLAQLHQLRGRVGRGRKRGQCLLVAETSAPEAITRLERFAATQSGFEVAEIDLEERGMGEFDGFRQHGILDLRIARLPRDLDLLARARIDSRQEGRDGPFRVVLGAARPGAAGSSLPG